MKFEAKFVQDTSVNQTPCHKDTSANRHSCLDSHQIQVLAYFISLTSDLNMFNG